MVDLTNPLQPPTPKKKEEYVRERIIFEDFDAKFDPNSGLMLLLYGPSGAGKTWFVGTAKNSLYLNTGGGEDTLRSPLFNSKYPDIKRKIVNIFETFEGDGLVKKSRAFDRTCDAVDLFMEDGDLRDFVKTVIIDDATALRGHALRRGIEIMDSNKPDSKKRRLDRFVNTDASDIGREMKMIDWFLTQYTQQFKSEGINFILTAHERRIYGKAPKMMDERPLKDIKPGFSGQTFPDEVPGHFDEVWYIERKEDPRKGDYAQIKTGGSGIETVKTRRAGVFAHYELGKDFEQLLEQRRQNKLHSSFEKYAKNLT